MKKSKFTEAREHLRHQTGRDRRKSGRSMPKMGASEATFYNWKKELAGLGVSELRKLRQLEEENRQLKQLVADLGPGQADAAGRGHDAGARLQVWKDLKASPTQGAGGGAD